MIGMCRPPTPDEWRLAQVWCSALMIVEVAFGVFDDPNWREPPGGDYVADVGSVIVANLGRVPALIDRGDAFLSRVSTSRNRLWPDELAIVRDTSAFRDNGGSGPTREACMVGMALANAIKAMHRTPTFRRIRLPDHSEPLTILKAELDEGTTASVAATVALPRFRRCHSARRIAGQFAS